MAFDYQRIRALREKRGLTQQAAADAAGMAQSRWSEIESGRNPNPAYQTLEKVAEALGVTVSHLVRTERD